MRRGGGGVGCGDDGGEQEVRFDENFITLEEVRGAMKSTRNGKAPEDDCIPFEILQAGGEGVIHQLLEIFNVAYESENIPKDWQMGVIC